MILYKTNSDGEIITGKSDKGFYGEDVYNNREWMTTPPPQEDGKIPVIENRKWVLKTDIRGIYYDKETSQKIVINSLNEDINNLTKEVPIEGYPNKFENDIWVIDIDKFKKLKEFEIINAFNNEISNGKFMSTTIEIEIDCRRSNLKNDLQNVQGLISYMTRNSLTVTDYKGFSETKVGVTIAQLNSICNEMEDHVFDLYNKKWALEAQIQSAITVEQLNQIKW